MQSKKNISKRQHVVKCGKSVLSQMKGHCLILTRRGTTVLCCDLACTWRKTVPLSVLGYPHYIREITTARYHIIPLSREHAQWQQKSASNLAKPAKCCSKALNFLYSHSIKLESLNCPDHSTDFSYSAL